MKDGLQLRRHGSLVTFRLRNFSDTYFWFQPILFTYTHILVWNVRFVMVSWASYSYIAHNFRFSEVTKFYISSW